MIELTVPVLFATGLAASPHCGLMCAPLQASVLRLHRDMPMRRALLLLHAGRVTGYAALGAASGLLGWWLLASAPSVVWGRALQIAAALLLVVIGLRQLGLGPARSPSRCRPPALPRGFARIPQSLRLFLLGMAWAAMPCGLLYAVLALSAMSGSAGFGAVLLAAFGLGSAPLLGGSGALLASAGRLRALRHAGGLLMIAAGAMTATAALLHPHGVAAWCATIGVPAVGGETSVMLQTMHETDGPAR